MAILDDMQRRANAQDKQLRRRIQQDHTAPTSEEQELASQVIDQISKRFAVQISNGNLESYTPQIKRAITEECARLDLPSKEQTYRIEDIVKNQVLGHGPIEQFLHDDTVTEIVVQRYDNIVIERAGKIQKTDVAFYNERHLQITIERIVQAVGRQINQVNPIVDARLEDGSRVNATIPPVSPDGATLTIRKFNHHKLTGQDYLKAGSLNKPMLYFLERCVRGKITMFVSGGTGTGKTTMLNMLSQFIPDDELIITIEDTLELQLQQPNVRRMEVRLSTNPTMMQVDQTALVKAALRQRPDRIILGETRDGSIVDLISAMSTGHEGSLSTIHANSPQNMCDVRIPILYSENPEANFSEKSIALQIAEAIQVIVQLSRMPDGSRKVTSISYVDGLTADGKVNVKDIFIYDRMQKQFRPTGIVPDPIIQKVKAHGYEFRTDIFQS